MSDEFGESDDEALMFAATQAESSFDATNDFGGSPRPAKRRRLHAIEEYSDDEPAFDPAPLRGRIARARDTSKHSEPIRSRNNSLGGSPPRDLHFPDSVHVGYDDAALDDDIAETLDDELERLAAEKAANPGKFSRYKLHVPKHQPHLEDRYYTQLPTQAVASTQPHHIRGAIWQKRPNVLQCQPNEAEDDSGIGLDENEEARQGIWGVVAETQKDDRENRHPDLEGIPSDAFDSSSPAIAHQRLVAPINNLRQTTLFGREGANGRQSQTNMRYNWPLAAKSEPPTHHKLDEEAVKTWVYPTNLGTVREYQFNIVSRGLYHNTLVALPTGLGKTFIAATIMLNWFRWTAGAQIVFVAPTKPLVAQQVEACFGIAGIPRSQTTMLTGDISPALREEEWQSKRVFFMTPQTFINDLKLGTCDPKRIVLVVIDEAHRATGAYAYVEVVKFIRRFNESFRILALTATPGSDVEAVQQVIDGLDISRVEIRTEQSLDIRQYVHTRKIEKQVFDNSDEMDMLMDLFSKAVKPVLNILNTQNAYWQKDPCDLTPFGLTKARQSWMASEAGRNANPGLKNMVNYIFSMLASLAHSMNLLKYHGIMPFYHALLSFKNEESKSKYRKQVLESKEFALMLQRLRAFSVDPDFLGHPKLAALRQVVLNHFMDNGETTRVMIFAHFRDAAEDIVKTLARDQPMIKPHVFNGQAGAKNSEGMSQKKQIEVVQNFKSGKFNTLVATSIGEEGLDIGEVDLIICYDSKASPIRMLQRMGRTGRKRQGKIVLFQMRGKEEQDADKAKDSYEKMQEMIADGGRFNFHDDRSRRILPKDANPQVDKKIIDIPVENSQAGLPTPQRRTTKGRKTKRPTKKFHMPDGVRTGFTRASRVDDDEDEGGGVDEFFLRRSKSPTKQSAVEEESLPIPPLEEVYLNDEEQAKCERQYQHVDEEEDTVVRAPRLDAFPERQRTASRTKLVSHRSLTFAVCEKIWHPTDLDGEYPTLSQTTDPPDIIVEDTISAPPRKPLTSRQQTTANSKPETATKAKSHVKSKKKPQARARAETDMSAEAMEADASSPPPISSAMALPSQGIWLGTADTDGEDENELPDSELADFIVDDEAPVELADDSSLPNLSQIQTKTQSKQGIQRQDAASTAEETESDDHDEDEDDLPDIGEIGRSASAPKGKPAGKPPPMRQAQRSRRVINDSSDEE